MIAWAMDYAIVVIVIGMAMTAWRLVAGPSSVDRVLAIDTLYLNTVGLVILLGMRLSSDLLFEAALVIALLGFVSTVALSRFVARGDVME